MSDVVDALIVGGGPSGLACAVELRRLGAGRVVVLEREPEPGGIARHSLHLGYGIRDLHRVMDGPAYAKAWTAKAEHAGVEIRRSTTATGWLASPQLGMHITSSAGIEAIAARSVVLATGCRERPRSARLVAGTRPSGIFTTGSLQQVAALRLGREQPGSSVCIGTRAVVVGTELVSLSAVMTLHHLGCDIVAMVESASKPAGPPIAGATLARRHLADVITSADVAEIVGRERIEAVMLTNGRRIDCDTVVFTGDWVPDHELARQSPTDLGLAPGWRGPKTDQDGRTASPGVFAVGNLLHGALTADQCALEGRHVAGAIAGFLGDGRWPEGGVAVQVSAPLAWASPTLLRGPGRIVVGSARGTAQTARIVLTQDGAVIHRSRRRRLRAGWPLTIGPDALRSMNYSGGPMEVTIS